MSEPLSPPPPFPPDDQALEEFLAGRSELSRRYREDAAGIQAPQAFDAAILAAARQAVAAPAPKPAPRRIHRWRLPLSLAATLVVGIGVLREVGRDPRLQAELTGEAAVVAGAAESVRFRRQVEAEPQPAMEVASPEIPPTERPGRAAVRQKREPVLQAHQPGTAQSSASAMAESPSASAAPAAPVAPAPATAAADASLAEPAAGNVLTSEYSAPAAKAEMAPAPVRSLPKAAMAAPAPLADAGSGPALGWRAAEYRGLLLGAASFAEVIAKLELPTSTVLPASRLLTLARSERPPAGSIELQFSADDRLQSVRISLDPPMPLATAEQTVMPVGPFVLLDQTALRCPDPARHLPAVSDDSRVRLYPAAGLYLRVSAAGEVSEIGYLQACR